jgi:hypothetical protein
MEDLSQTFHAIKELLHPKALREKDLMSHENPINLKAEKSFPIALDDVTFSFGLGAAMQVELFNDEDDADDNAFLATKDCPIVLNTATDAYLKYTSMVSAKANQQVTLANIGFDLDLSAAGSAKAVYYKKHANSQLVRDAFAEDLKHFKTIFKFEDVESLEENNGLGFIANGSLSCNLKVSWSNILSTGISTLSSQLPLPVTLDISLVPSLTASFNLSVTDDFAYLLKKQANNQYLISITKKKSNSIGISAGATIGVKFADPDELGKQVGALCDKIIQSVLGNTIMEINTAVTNFKQGKKSPIIEKLFNLFHLDKLPQPIDLLTPKLKQLEQDISNAVTKLATESVSFSFSYQYNRIKEETELLSGVITGSDLKKYHGDLLRFKTGKLLDAIRNATIPFTLNSYLNEKVLTITKSWGLGLTLFDITILTSKNYKELKDTVQTDLSRTRSKVLLDRTEGYKWKLMKGSGSWMGQLSAAMPDLAPGATLDKFGFTWLFNTVLKDPKVSEQDLRGYLDSAVLWGAVNAGDVDALVQKYGDLKGKEVVVEGKLLFPDTVMRALLQQIAADGWGAANKKQLARALGAAMTFLPEFQSRVNPQVRQEVYAPLWADYLDNPKQTPDEYAALAESEIEGMGDPDHLAEFEAKPENWIFGNTFAGVIQSNPDLQDYLKSFITGIVELQSRIQGQANYTLFDHAYSQITGYLKYPFGYVAAGRFLLLYAMDLNLTKDIKKVLTLSYGPEKNRTVINCSVV